MTDSECETDDTDGDSGESYGDWPSKNPSASHWPSESVQKIKSRGLIQFDDKKKQLAVIVYARNYTVWGELKDHFNRLNAPQQFVCVSGYLRKYCTKLPTELVGLCIVTCCTDFWNRNRSPKALQITDDAAVSAVKVKYKHGHQWLSAFGSLVIQKGQCKEWSLRQYAQPPYQIRKCNDNVIGIIATDKISSFDDVFVSKKNGGYGIFSRNGRKMHAGKGSEFCTGWPRLDNSRRFLETIVVKLDMTGKYGVLSYEMDFKRKVAFDSIDIDKTYCLAVSMFWIHDGFRIIKHH